jgi:Domain of unknown function (DUF4440)
MTRRLTCVLPLCGVLALASSAAAQTWTAEQQEIWRFEQKQWQMEKDKDASWIETMVHPNLHYWGLGAPVPQDKASLARWNRYSSASSSVLEQELYPIAATITGDVAVVQYRYQIARENDKKERETVWGHYTDILIKENGKWLFIAWEGGDDPKK